MQFLDLRTGRMGDTAAGPWSGLDEQPQPAGMNPEIMRRLPQITPGSAPSVEPLPIPVQPLNERRQGDPFITPNTPPIRPTSPSGFLDLNTYGGGNQYAGLGGGVTTGDASTPGAYYTGGSSSRDPYRGADPVERNPNVIDMRTITEPDRRYNVRPGDYDPSQVPTWTGNPAINPRPMYTDPNQFVGPQQRYAAPPPIELDPNASFNDRFYPSAADYVNQGFQDLYRGPQTSRDDYLTPSYSGSRSDMYDDPRGDYVGTDYSTAAGRASMGSDYVTAGAGTVPGGYGHIPASSLYHYVAPQMNMPQGGVGAGGIQMAAGWSAPPPSYITGPGGGAMVNYQPLGF